MSLLPAVPEREASLKLDEVFCKAKKAFLESLTAEEQAQFSGCSSAQALVNEVKKFEVVVKAKQRGLGFARKIQSLGDNLSPYFKIIEIFCGAHPEYANLAWGAMRLILQLASNFATFFEKLCETIRRLSLALPQFEDIFRWLESVSKDTMSLRLRNSIILFYSDLFEFFQAVTRVFSDKKGKIKRSPIVIGDLLWKPFDLRFQNILERMNFHQKLLKEELHWGSVTNIQRTLQNQVQVSKDTKKIVTQISSLTATLEIKFDQEQRNKFCASVLKWLEPPHFATPFEQAQDTRENGTAEWLFDDFKFKAWRESSSGGILWVQGNPGCGKTILAASTVDELRDDQRVRLDSLPIVCYYFFYEGINQKASRLGAYRALATQLFQQCNQFEQIYNIFALANDGLRTAVSEHELLDLLRITLTQLSNVYFILDGIDECKDNAKFMSELCKISSSSRLKSVIFSRPNVSCLRRSIQEEQKIHMSRDTLDKDIKMFLGSELNSLKVSSLLPADFDIAFARDILLQRADGMFLWARLMTCYLNSTALTRLERIEEISKSTPEGLEDMYLKIFNHIRSMDRASRQLASRVFMWVGYGRSSLTPEQLKEVVWRNQSSSSTADQLDDIDHGIIVSCCGLIEKRQNNHLHFIHLTAREFILSPRLLSEFGSSFVLLNDEAASEMCQQCISYLRLTVPARPLSGDIHKHLPLDELRATYPFLEYAAPYWADHARDSLPMPQTEWSLGYNKFTQLGASLQEFIAAKLSLMLWVEATYTLGAFSTIKAIDNLAKALAALLQIDRISFPASVRQVAKELTDLVVDLTALDANWRTTLLTRPHEIWNDITVFSSSRFFVRTSAATISYLTPQNPAELCHSKTPLFSTSSNSINGQLIATLTIWPSNIFTQFWEAPAWDNLSSPLTEDCLNHLQAISKGWTARYELFTLEDKPIPRSTADLPLVSTEICLLLRQSLRSSCLKHWTMSFPMLISKDLSAAIVLRTVFDFELEAKTKTIAYRSALISLQSSNWSQSQDFFGYTYSYDWLISSDSRFIVYNSLDRSPYSDSEPLAIFRITRGINLEIECVRRVTGLKANHFDYTFCALHPWGSQFICTSAGSVWLTDLESQEDMIKLLDLQPNEMRNHDNVVVNCLGTFQEGNIKEIGFSACGAYITITYNGIQWPQIYPIHLPDSTAEAAVDRQPLSVSNSDSADSRKRKIELSGHSTMQVSKIPKVIHTGSMVIQQAGPAVNGVLQLLHHALPQNIELLTGAQDSSPMAISLVRVPEEINIEHTKSTVLWPANQNTPIQVIINTSTKRSYDSDETHTSQFLPAVLSRDQRSLAPPYKVESQGRAIAWGPQRLEGVADLNETGPFLE